MAAHRYWRINVTSAKDNPYIALISELEMRAVAGGPNLPLTVGGTATAMAFNDAGTKPSNAFDGSAGTAWQGYNAGGVRWLQWDFGAGSPQDIKEFKVVNGTSEPFAPIAGNFAYSDDGTTWTVALTFAGRSTTAGAASTHTVLTVESANIAVTAPMGAASLWGGGTIKLSPPTPKVTGFFGGHVEAAAPMAQLWMAGHDATGERDLTIFVPMASVALCGGANALITAPRPTVVMTGVAETTMQAVLAAPMALVVATGLVGGVADLVAVAPMAGIKAFGGGGIWASARMAQLGMTGLSGGVGSVLAGPPMPTLVMAAVSERHGGIAVVAPMAFLSAANTLYISAPMGRLVASGSVIIAVSYEAYSINLSHRGPEANDEVSRYDNFPFDRIVRYQGSYFGVAADGLYLLEGTTDDGTAIPYAVKTCIDDFKAPELKTVASAYFSGRLGPDATITLHAGEQGQESYPYNTPRGQGAQNHREKFGRGVKNRYFAIGVAGDGALELDTIELEVNKMSRRI